MSFFPKPYQVTTGINLKNTGATAIFTNNSGQDALVRVYEVITAASGVLSVPTVSLGTADPYTNVLAATALTGLDAVDEVIDFMGVAAGLVFRRIKTGETLYHNVTVAATGTTLTAKVVVDGVYC